MTQIMHVYDQCYEYVEYLRATDPDISFSSWQREKFPGGQNRGS